MTRRGILIISVALNLGLAIVAIAAFRKPPPAPAPPAAREAEPPALVQKITRTREITEPDQIVSLAWNKVESGEYPQYISNLRAIGCPEETIRDIVIADINKHFAQRWRDMNPPREYKYWKHGRSSGDEPTREANARNKAREELLREKRQLVRTLLGVDLAEDGERYADPSFRGSSADMEAYNFLTAEKRQVFREIRDKYEIQFRAIFDQQDPDGFLAPELRVQANAFRAQAEAEMQQALGPAELEQFQLRFSGTAGNLRNLLAGFEPSEAEFRQIYGLRKAVDDEFANATPGDPEAARKRAEAVARIDQDLQKVLTPERYAAYQLSQQREYREALSFASAWDLPRETAANLYDIRRAVEQKVQQLPAGSAEQLAALQRETEKALRDTLGEKAFNSYRRNQTWLRSLGQERTAARSR